MQVQARKHFHVDYKAVLPERFEIDIEKRYVMDKLVLGAGGFGKVFVARDSKFNNRLVAVKKVTQTTDKGKATTAYSEVNIMKELDHPCICKLFETFEEGRHLYFIMEFLEGGEVFTRIIESGHISEKVTVEITRQIVSALHYAHNKQVAHRDIKPENLVFCSKDPDDNRIKLIDWGFGVNFSGEVMKAAVGSFSYAAPEVVMSKNVTAYTCACDLWSTGVVTYVMLCGKPPFWGPAKQHLKNARNEKYPMSSPPWDKISTQAKLFIQQLLKADPAKRMTAEAASSHPWLETREDHADPEQMLSVMQNLQKFQDRDALVQLCVTTIARQMDHTQLKKIHQVFADCDKDHNGTLSAEEIANVQKKLLGESDGGEIAQLFDMLDLDGSGEVDYTEFCAAALGENFSNKVHSIWAGFKAFDIDDNGLLSKDELVKLMKNVDIQRAWSPEFCESFTEQILAKYDLDKDGGISFEEWLEYMNSSWGGGEDGQMGLTPEFMETYAALKPTSAQEDEAEAEA